MIEPGEDSPPGEGYRWIKKGETLQVGDEWPDGYEWVSTVYVGKKSLKDRFYRRKVQNDTTCQEVCAKPESGLNSEERLEFERLKAQDARAKEIADKLINCRWEDSNQQLLERFANLVNNAHPNCKPFIEIILEGLELHTSKSHDYGSGDDPYANVRASEEFGVPAWQGSVIRANDKIIRIKSFIEKGGLKHETIEDSILDLVVYWPIILMLFREEKNRGQVS